MNPEHTTEADAIADLVTPTTLVLPLTEQTVVIIPDGNGGAKLVPSRELLKTYDTRPRRRIGTARLDDLTSFAAHVNRNKGPSSALFASKAPTPSLLAVFDYNDAGPELPEGNAARFGHHRAAYHFPASDEWAAWSSKQLANLSQTAFAEFLEDRAVDVIEPKRASEATADLCASLDLALASPARIMELSKGLAVRVNSKVAAAVNLASGEGQFTYATEHQDEAGASLKIPKAFLISLPVFAEDAPYQVLVRMRYRVKEGHVTWTLAPHDLPRILAHAFTIAAKGAAEATGLPLFLGQPEA